MLFQKIGQNGRPGGREPPRSISFDETSRMVLVWGRTGKLIFCDFCDLQKSRHLQKSRVTERHNRGTQRKLKSHPPPQKRREAHFSAPGATSILCADCVARGSRGADFLNFAWPEATQNWKISGLAARLPRFFRFGLPAKSEKSGQTRPAALGPKFSNFRWPTGGIQ